MGDNARRFLERLDPHQGTLTAYCRRLLWSAGDLEDALQETLTVALRERDLPAPGEFRPWILRIATWTCFTFNRRHRRARELEPLERADREPQRAAETLERECTYEEILADPQGVCERFGDELAQACRRLHEKERAILLLKILGGLTCPEIARALDVPLGTAQGLLGRARQKLREHLTDNVRARRNAAQPATWRKR